MSGSKMPRRPLRSGRGTLWVIAVILAGSAVLRLTGETGQALAREIAEIATDETDEALACTPEAGTAALLEALAEREDALVAREAEIADRARTVELAEQEARETLAALARAEQRLSATIAQAETAAEDDLSQLTAVYENMKPKEAATLFAAMAPDFAAGFLGRMRPDAAAAVMAGMPPDAAYSISVILAGRNARVPTE